MSKDTVLTDINGTQIMPITRAQNVYTSATETLAEALDNKVSKKDLEDLIIGEIPTEYMESIISQEVTEYVNENNGGFATQTDVSNLSNDFDNFFNMYKLNEMELTPILSKMRYGMFSVEGDVFHDIKNRMSTKFRITAPSIVQANEGYVLQVFKTSADTYAEMNNDNTSKWTKTWCESVAIIEAGLYVISYKRIDEGEIDETDLELSVIFYSSAHSNVYYEIRNDIAVGTNSNKYFVYESSGGTQAVIVEAQKGEEIKYIIKNINRCRVVTFNKRFKDITMVVTHNNPEEVADSVLAYDDNKTEFSGVYKVTNEVETLIFYVSSDLTTELNISLLKLHSLPDNIRVNSKNIDYGMPKPQFIAEFERFEEDYSADASDYRKQPTTQEEFYDLFYNPYLGFSKNGAYRVTKKILGKDQSATYDVFEYDFCPKNYIKTILLTSGLHAYETPASFGLAMWIRDLMNEKNETFKWIKENVRVKVIPIANPWGFNQYPKKYGNVNGVNPNRNFDDWNKSWESFPTYSSDPSDTNYNEWNVKGSEPFSESETRIIAEWLNANKESVFWIDCHTGFDNRKGENWILYQSTNPYKGKIRFAMQLLEKRIAEKYGTTPQSTVQINLETSIKIKYSNDVVGIPCMVIEQCGVTNSYGNDVNNEPILITEYATTLNAYVVAQLMID